MQLLLNCAKKEDSTSEKVENTSEEEVDTTVEKEDTTSTLSMDSLLAAVSENCLVASLSH